MPATLALFVYQLYRGGLEAAGSVFATFMLLGFVSFTAQWLGGRWARRHGRPD